MSRREEVLEVLTGSEVTRIRFSFLSLYGTPVAVDNTTFMRVAQAIMSGFVQVPESGIAPGSGGQYDGRPESGGVLYARPTRNNRNRKCSIVHEAVHASFDLTRSTISEVDNETASFLAEYLYLRFTAYPIRTLLEDNPHQARFAELLWRATGYIARGDSVPTWQIDEIRRQISERPDYSYVLSEGCLDGASDCFYVLTAQNG